MEITVVNAPLALLHDPDLDPSARLLWLASHLPQPTAGAAELGDRTGLSRPTVRKALLQLTAAGWPPTEASMAPGTTVGYPGHLIIDRRAGVTGRLLYGLLQTTPGFVDAKGSFTYT